MKNFRMLIADQHTAGIDLLKAHLTQWGHEVVGIASSYQEAKQLYRKEQPDMSLVAFRLKGAGTGIDLGHFIRKQPQPKPFIYLCSPLNHRDVQRAKATFPAGCLTKPIQKESLYNTIEVAMHRHLMQAGETLPAISLSQGATNYVLPVEDILYLQADHVYVQVHTVEGKRILQRRSLSELLEQLPDSQFVQTHRSFAVNVRQLSHWNKEHVYVRDQAVPLSRSRRKEVFSVLESMAHTA